MVGKDISLGWIPESELVDRCHGTPASEASVPLVQCAISDNGQYNVTVHADVITISKAKQARIVGKTCHDKEDVAENDTDLLLGEDDRSDVPRRGRITMFSKRSRKRMIETLAKFNGVNELKFVTVTYRDENWFGDDLTPRDFARHLASIMKLIEHTWPTAAIVWRKEYKARKSGNHIGEIVPHAHLIVHGVDSVQFKQWLSRAWSRISGAERIGEQARVDVQIAANRRHAYAYVSKYVAKEDDEELCEYFHNHEGEIGRHWGYRGAWDMTPSVRVTICGDVLVALKRLLRSWLRARGNVRFAKIAARINSEFGVTILGIGHESSGGLGHALRMIGAARDVASDKLSARFEFVEA